MTEQSANYRQSITVPDRHFRAIGEWYLNAAEMLESQGVIGQGDEEPHGGYYNQQSGGDHRGPRGGRNNNQHHQNQNQGGYETQGDGAGRANKGGHGTRRRS